MGPVEDGVEDSDALKQKLYGLSPSFIISLACFSEKIWENVHFLEINAVKQHNIPDA